MAAANTDLLMEVGDPGTATTLSAPGYTTGGTSITVGATANWPTATGVVFAIDTVTVVDGVEVQDAGSYNEFVGTVDTGTTVTNVDWKRGSGDRDYAAGATTRVYIPVSAERENRIVEWGTQEHKQDGTHGDLTADSLTVANNIDIADGNGLRDGNDNEVLTIGQTASAVNNVKLTNSATGDAVVVEAVGDDTDVDFQLKAKGAGTVQNGRPIAFKGKPSQSFNNATQVQITTYTEVYDYGDNFASGDFTAPYDGIYHFNALVRFNDIADGGRVIIFLDIDNVQDARAEGASSAATHDPSATIAIDVDLTAGQVVHLEAYQSGGGASLPIADGHFAGHLVGRTD